MTEETQSPEDGDDVVTSNPGGQPVCENDGPHRRSFFTRFAAGTIGLFVGVVPAIPGVMFLLDPLLRKRTKGAVGDSTVEKDKDGYIKLTVTVDALPEDGSPQIYKVYDDKVDAWNKYLNVVIGTVWLKKSASGQVIAFNTICPHLGCAIEYRSGQSDYYCPCHLSAFDLDGKKKNPIPPRNMDALSIKPNTGNEIWIKYQEFRAATAEQIPIS